MRDILKRIEVLEQLSRKHGKVFTARLKDGRSVKTDATGAIMLVKDQSAQEISIDFMARGCGQLCALMNDLLN